MKKLLEAEGFRQAVDLIITPVILVGDGSRHLYHNKAFLSQIGYGTDDIPDTNAWFEKAYPDEKHRREVKDRWNKHLIDSEINNGTHVHMIAKICCKDQTFKWFDIHENWIGSNRVVTFLDINELQETNQELTDVLKQKDTLLSIIAHDVRGPLAIIRSVIDNYKEMELTEEELVDVFFGVGHQIDYVFDIINSLLTRTRTNNGWFATKREQVNLTDLFEKYRDYYKDQLVHKNIDFIVELMPGQTVNYDLYILDIISRNLINNAIKFTPDNGAINISFKKLAGRSEVVIKDTGPGMSKEQKRLVLNNMPGRLQKNRASDGFGLGLIMAKEILEKNQGELSIKSEPGKGTSFVIAMLDK